MLSFLFLKRQRYLFFNKDFMILFILFFLSFSMTNSLVFVLFYVHSWENVLLFNVIKVTKINFCMNTLLSKEHLLNCPSVVDCRYKTFDVAILVFGTICFMRGQFEYNLCIAFVYLSEKDWLLYCKRKIFILYSTIFLQF